MAAEHARLELKSGRLFCTALSAMDPDNMLSPTATWIDGTQLRSNVAYMVAPGAVLRFGDGGPEFVVSHFTEAGGAGGMAEMLMKGMASQASGEVQEQLKSLE